MRSKEKGTAAKRVVAPDPINDCLPVVHPRRHIP